MPVVGLAAKGVDEIENVVGRRVLDAHNRMAQARQFALRRLDLQLEPTSTQKWGHAAHQADTEAHGQDAS